MGLKLLWWLFGVIGSLISVVVLSVASCIPMVTDHVIRADLRYYGQQVRASSLPLGEKIKLLDRIEAISDRVEEDGSRIGLVRWLEADEVLRTLLKHRMTSDDVVLADRELRRVQRRVAE